ncbi:MAG: histidinol-phosphatase [Clostridia bacterium]|nr:histidinol-phosphatase [Clostridia bacterium]
MKANYHTHTSRCKHAIGSEEDYVKKAIKEGLEVLGFSDHAPFNFSKNYLSHCRMRMDEIGDYFDVLLNLREKYKNEIQILIGFEIEYYENLWEDALNAYRKYPLDYMILGEHFVYDESINLVDQIVPYTDRAVLDDYVDHCIKAINTNRISYVAHPDYSNFTGDNEEYLESMSRLVLEAKKLNLPLEYNLYGMRLGRIYPNERFWKMVGEIGAPVIFGCDCHKIEHVADKAEIEEANRRADKLKLNVIDKLTLKNPIF